MSDLLHSPSNTEPDASSSTEKGAAAADDLLKNFGVLSFRPGRHLEQLVKRERRDAVRHALLDRISRGTCGGANLELWFTEAGQIDPSVPAAATIQAELAALRTRYLAGGLTWTDANAVIRRLLPLLPLDRVDAIRCSTRTYYYQRATAPYIADYDRSSPPALNALATVPRDATGNVPPDLERAIRSDAVRLQDEITRIEIYRPYQEEKRTEITKGLSLAFAAVTIILGLAGLSLRHRFGNVFPVVPAVMALGALGATVSAQRRLQDSFDQDASILNVTKYLRVPPSVYLVPVIGAIFAFVLMLVLTAGLFPTDLAPQLSPVLAKPDGKTWQMLTVGPIGSEVEYAKLLVYAFLAGFAERLVPDTLDRLAGVKKT
jgi:hypothetical protein